MKTLGYLGLGVMGYGMTGNLIDKSGCDIYGYDPVPALRERFAARGGKVLDDAKTLYKTCDIIFMCLPTNAIVKATKVDGIYDKDPAKYPDAVKFSTITFDETLNRHIGVMDATAFALLRDNKVPIIVCRMLGGDILKAVKGESVGTIVTG